MSFARIWKLKEKAFNSKIDNLSPVLIDPTDLNLELAKHSITLHKGSPKDINSLVINGFAGIEITNRNDNSFFRDIKKELEFDYFSTAEFNTELIREKVSEMQNVLIALYPPMVKPQNNFGISEEYLMLLREMIETKKRCFISFWESLCIKGF